MARIQYGALVTELKGKIGGTVFQSGRYGFQVRNKPTPIRTASGVQARVRGIMLTVSKAWRTLTSAERLAFDAIAPSWPALDSFGNPMLLTGYNVFCKTNWWLSQMDLPMNNVASLPAALWQPTSLGLNVAVGTSTFELSFLPTPIDNFTTAVIYVSGQVSAGRSTPPSNMSTIAGLAVGTVSPADISAFFTVKSGTFPTAGNRVFVGVQAVSTVNGTAGPIVYVSTIVLP